LAFLLLYLIYPSKIYFLHNYRKMNPCRCLIHSFLNPDRMIKRGRETLEAERSTPCLITEREGI